jgi:hypothetical protein
MTSGASFTAASDANLTLSGGEPPGTARPGRQQVGQRLGKGSTWTDDIPGIMVL